MEQYLKDFEKNGYIVLKKAICKKQCKSLIKKTIIPILHKKGIYLSKPDTWKDKDNNSKSGELFYGKNGGHIISKKDKNFRFPALFNSKKLNKIIDCLHSRNAKNKWKYDTLAKEGLGWMHLRYPFYNYYDKFSDKVICPEDSFHLDGTNNKINTRQSVVLLPFITTIDKNEGGTAVIPGSHKLINDYILRYNYKTNMELDIAIDKISKDNSKDIIDVTGEQGDILIMHPNLIHSSSFADINSKVRITFNLSINYKLKKNNIL
jgi:hypothetical protein